MHALKVFRLPVWLLLHKLFSPHYRYIRKMRRGDRLPLTQKLYLCTVWIKVLLCQMFRNTPRHKVRSLSSYTCVQCGSRYCCVRCLETHQRHKVRSLSNYTCVQCGSRYCCQMFRNTPRYKVRSLSNYICVQCGSRYCVRCLGTHQDTR